MLEMAERSGFGGPYRTHRHRTRAPSLRDTGVFLAISLLHVIGIYYFSSLMPNGREALWTSLEASFIPREKPKDPPPPPPIPTLLTDAFTETPLLDIPAPSVEVAVPEDEGTAIHIEKPEPPADVEQDAAPPQGDEGFGPITKPRVLSRPRVLDRYPPASVHYRESGHPVIKICISEQGTVTDVQLAQSSGFQRLDEAAVDLGWDYVFAPALREGKPLAVCLPYGITFRINIGGVRARR
jgi:periplasmic protein TonB